MPTTIIYDCDGVLLDSEVLHIAVELEQLASIGVNPDRETYMRRYVGLAPGRWRRQLIADVEAETGQTLDDEFFARLDVAWHEAMHRGLAVVPGVREALDQIPGPRCVASSTPQHQLEWKLEHTQLASAFGRRVFSSDAVEQGKPAPDLFLYAAEALAATPADCIVVEDSLNGVLAGVAANMRVVGFTGGGHCGPNHAAALREAGAVATAASMAELPSVIARV